MAFVTNSTKTVEIPHEPANFVTIRRPRRQALIEAANLRQEKALKRMDALGGEKALALMRAAAQPTPAPAAEAAIATAVAAAEAPKEPTPAELAAVYDADALLLAGIVQWGGPIYDGIAVSADTIADLDPQTTQLLAETIAVFATGKETTSKNA